MLKTFSEYENKQKYTRGQTKERLQKQTKKLHQAQHLFMTDIICIFYDSSHAEICLISYICYHAWIIDRLFPSF